VGENVIERKKEREREDWREGDRMESSSCSDLVGPIRPYFHDEGERALIITGVHHAIRHFELVRPLIEAEVQAQPLLKEGRALEQVTEPYLPPIACAAGLLAGSGASLL
jgi:hypothetical protein